MEIWALLQTVMNNQASDLHLSSGLPAMQRLHGEIHPLAETAFSAADVRRILREVMTQSQQEELEQNLECDFSLDFSGVGRFRVNAFHQARGLSAVFRVIPAITPKLDDLRAPIILKDIADSPHGLVLVTGATGSGKSTTLTAMLDYINQQRAAHIITLEDPIEFVHSPKKSLIQQREIGAHTQSFSQALRSALREDPDVILVGEMRDLESIRLALTAAETGHLVLASLHTNSAAKTIDRIVDAFPAGEKEMIRTMLAESLKAVVSQTLCQNLAGQGRLAAYEVMVVTTAIRHLIRENKIAQIYSAIQTGQSLGMQTLDQHLAILRDQNLISLKEARQKAVSKDLFQG